MTLVILSLAAALGAVIRYEVEKFSSKKLGERFPYGTLFANVLGSFLLGYAISRTYWSAETVLFLSSFCGAFTTFGGFIGQTHHRLRHSSEKPIAIIYLCLTIALSLFAAWLGLTA